MNYKPVNSFTNQDSNRSCRQLRVESLGYLQDFLAPVVAFPLYCYTFVIQA